MAERIPKPPKAKAAPKGRAQAAAPDIEVLHPEREVDLSTGSVTVREYGNVEWLRLLPQAEPLVASVTEMLSALIVPSYEDVLAAIAHHTDALLPLVVQAADQDMAWLETLKGNDLENLLMTWWGVNGHFFVRRAQNRVTVLYQERALARPPSTGTAPPRARARV